MVTFRLPPSDRALSGAAALVGVGETDYGDDYAAARAKEPDWQAPTPEGLATLAFERALVDSGLRRNDIDGLLVSFMYGGPDLSEVPALLDITPRWLAEAPIGIMAGPIPAACAAIASGQCDTVALVYAVASRSVGRKFGGQGHQASAATPPSYYYYHPWGWSSQAAHWAFVAQHYMTRYGSTEADMGSLALQLRANAMAHPQAIMRKPLTIEDYLGSRYIVEPLHLLDMCLVNDGGVCLIIRRADLAKDATKVPIGVAGWGEAAATANKLEALVVDRLRPQFQAAGAQALGMAGLGLADVQHFEGYDAATMHLVNHIEGHGLIAEGETLAVCKAGGLAPTGQLPVNTAGGMMSGSYMHGWNHVAEIVHQLRHEAGARQVPDVEVSMFSLAQTDQVHPLVFTRGVRR